MTYEEASQKKKADRNRGIIMKIIEHFVTNEQGIHARPAMLLVYAAKKYSSDITLWKGDKGVDLKDMFQVMRLSVNQNTAVRFEINGADEDEAAKEITELIKDL